MAFTLGFRDEISSLDHFSRHGARLGVATLEEYIKKADIFLGGPKDSDIIECVRQNGNILRYNPVSDEFGVIDANKVILTFYVINLDLRAKAKYPTNINYFQRQCLQ